MGFFGFLMRVLKLRKDITTKEKLQGIDDELEKLDARLRRNLELQKSYTVYLITFSIIIYIISLVVVYLWYFPALWMHRFLYSVPFLIYPFLVYLSRRLLQYIFMNRIRTAATAAKDLKKDKKKILETVMDTETYKVAKELLQKYDPNGSLVEENVTPAKPVTPKPPSTPEGQELRRRNVPNVNTVTKPAAPPPIPHSSTNGYPLASPPARMHAITGSTAMRTPAPMMMRGSLPTPRLAVRPIAPILPRERSVFDKVADYFIGDGPSNRFALICKQCYGHNGMVLCEEFEFTSYRCCYCSFFNPSRKQRLNAPRLESFKNIARPSHPSAANLKEVESSNKSDNTEDDSDVSKEEKSTEEVDKKEVPEEPAATSENTDDVVKEESEPETIDDNSNNETDSANNETVEKLDTSEETDDVDKTNEDG